MEILQDISIQLIQVLQGLSPILDRFFKFFSFLGTPGFYILLVPLLYWIIDKKLGKTALLVLIFSAFLGLAFKQLLHQPRPYWLGEVQPLATDSTYGNPSTSASDSLAMFGCLAYRLNKEWLWAAARLCVFLIGFSRLYLGVRFPLGILSGWLLGLGVAYLFIKVDRLFLRRWTKLPSLWQVGIAFGFSIIMVLIGGGIILLITSLPNPPTWVGYATHGCSLTEYFILAGGLFGTASGFILMKKRLDFQTKGTWITKVGRCLLGLAGLGLIYLSLEWVINRIVTPETSPVHVLRYIQIALVIFWTLYGAPWFFLKFKLALASKRLII